MKPRRKTSIGHDTPHVAVLVDTATGWGRRLVRGILNYGQHGPWYLWIKSGGQDSPLWLPPGWRGDGIIARVGTRTAARRVGAAGVPVVNISAIELPGVEFPRVATDLEAAGRLAAEHLLDRGFAHFAYYGLAHRAYVDRHYRGFVEAVSSVCEDCPFYGTASDSGSGARTAWLTRQRGLWRWLKTLAKPVAIVTWTTELGRELIQACRRENLLVPEQVAVLAADNDDLLCEACAPSLSGMALTSERIGFEAAKLLDWLMHGGRSPQAPLLLEPTGVVARQSTDTLAVDDADLARAVAFIRGHATDPIQVQDVLREVPVSRRWLERRFREVLGRGPAAEIRRVRLERAKRFLAETDLPVPEVARLAGFGSREYLAAVFKAEGQLSPRQYRKRTQARR
ncbi:MAG: substrate-binding domain-containing protein [Rhodopirellula sp.]|nr:substrate-binding domain-containing protein [Rhodopirellula sp.]